MSIILREKDMHQAPLGTIITIAVLILEVSPKITKAFSMSATEHEGC
jgi:hypothetical protein